jgi:hypothetical protein
MLRKTAATAAHLLAAAGLIIGLGAVTTTGAATASAPAAAPAMFVLVESGVGAGGNTGDVVTGAVVTVPAGTVGQGGNVTAPTA